MSEIERWSVYLYYLKDETKLDVINQIVEKEKGVAMATAELLDFTRNNPEAVRRFQREKRELDAQVAELRKQELKKVVAEKDAIIANKDEQLQEKDEQLQEKDEQLVKITQEKDAEIMALKAQLAAVKSRQ